MKQRATYYVGKNFKQIKLGKNIGTRLNLDLSNDRPKQKTLVI